MSILKNYLCIWYWMYVFVVERGREFVLDCVFLIVLVVEELLFCSVEWIKIFFNKCMFIVWNGLFVYNIKWEEMIIIDCF